MSVAYQLGYMAKQAVSAKLVARALQRAVGVSTSRWEQLANKTNKWIDGAISRYHRARQQSLLPTGASVRLPVGSKALDDAAARAAGGYTPVRLMPTEVGTGGGVYSSGTGHVTLTDTVARSPYGASILAHELGHAADDRTGRLLPNLVNGLPLWRPTWRNELMANRLASQALRKPDVVEGFRQAGVTMPTPQQYLRWGNKTQLGGYRMNLLADVMRNPRLYPTASLPRWLGRTLPTQLPPIRVYPQPAPPTRLLPAQADVPSSVTSP